MPTGDKIWKSIDLVIKFLGAGIITGGIMFYGNMVQKSQEKINQQIVRLNSLIEITSKQKDLDVNLGIKMFEILMSHYFQKKDFFEKEKNPKGKILLMRLMALNFQDVPINLKPLFEELDSQLIEMQSKTQLRDVAKEVASRQAFRLSFQDGFDSGPISVKAGKVVQAANLPFKVKIEEVSEDAVKAIIDLEDRKIGPFSVSHYDIPIIDNVKIGEWRISIMFVRSDGKSAEIRLISFKSDLAADRFDIKEMSRLLREKKF